MAYAWIVTVDEIDTSRTDEMSARLRNELIPQVSSLPGFQKGYWFQHSAKDDAGAVILLFDSEEAAQQVSNPDDMPVTFRSRELYRLVGEA